MREYTIELKNGVTVFIKSKYVKVRQDNVLVFYNPRKSLTEQHLYGVEVVATFNSDEYSYFFESKPNLI